MKSLASADEIGSARSRTFSTASAMDAQFEERNHHLVSVPMRTMFATVIFAGSLVIAATAIVPLSVEWNRSVESFSSVSRKSIDTQSDIMRNMVLDKAKDSFGQEILKPVHFIDAAILRIELSGVDITALPSMRAAAQDTELLFTVGLGEMMTQMGFSTFSIATENDQGHHLFSIIAVWESMKPPPMSEIPDGPPPPPPADQPTPSIVNWGAYDQDQRNSSFTVSTFNVTSTTPTNETVSSIPDWPITTRPYWPLVTNRSRNTMWFLAYDPVTQVPMPLYAKRIPRRLGAHDGVLAISFELQWLTHYLSFFKITQDSFAMLFENTNQMNLIAVTDGTVIDPNSTVTYTVFNHPSSSVRRPVEKWLARTGGLRIEASFTEDGIYNDVCQLIVTESTVWWLFIVSPSGDFTGDGWAACSADGSRWTEASSSRALPIMFTMVLLLLCCCTFLCCCCIIVHPGVHLLVLVNADLLLLITGEIGLAA
eukprot:m51a1_g368 hypothetical protein (482) ;mRNA; r:616532-625587